jgi:hypothetical protein
MHGSLAVPACEAIAVGHPQLDGPTLGDEALGVIERPL